LCRFCVFNSALIMMSIQVWSINPSCGPQNYEYD
jgi:hypothetical protein